MEGQSDSERKLTRKGRVIEGVLNYTNKGEASAGQHWPWYESRKLLGWTAHFDPFNLAQADQQVLIWHG